MIRSLPLTAALILAAGSVASAQILREPRGSEQEPEVPTMPPAPRMTHPLSPAFSLATDTGFMVQVNVTAAGLNIVGDAANEPSIAIDPTAPNRMVIGWRQFDSITSNFRQAGYAWSNDGGRSWHFPGVFTPGFFRSDPIVETDAAGNFYYNSLPDQTAGWHCQVFKSPDGGQSWGPPVEANGGDRAWMAIDKSGGIGQGNLYDHWNASFSCCGPANFGRDTTGNTAPWIATQLPSNPGLATIAVGPSGEVYVAGSSGSNVRVMRSDNAQNAALTPTFPLSINVAMGATVLPSFAGNPDGASGQVWVDVNRSNGAARGHVYICATAGPFGADPSDVRFRRSTDNGATWSTAVRINDDAQAANHYQWFPSMSVAPNGRIDVTWNDTRNSLSSSMSQLFYSYSNDEGVTWSPNVALTPLWDSTIGWPQQNKIGDYYDQESDDVGLSIALSATFNGEQDVYYLRVNDNDCNRNGIPDAIDLAGGTLHDCNGNGIPDECERAAGITVVCPCYPNCDGSSTAPVLNVLDFACFLNAFAAGCS